MSDNSIWFMFWAAVFAAIVSFLTLAYQFGGDPDVAGVRMCVDLKADAKTCSKFLDWHGFETVDETKTVTTRTVRP